MNGGIGLFNTLPGGPVGEFHIPQGQARGILGFHHQVGTVIHFTCQQCEVRGSVDTARELLPVEVGAAPTRAFCFYCAGQRDGARQMLEGRG